MAREDRQGVHLDRPADHEPDRERGGGCERGHQDGAIHPPCCPNHRASSEGSPSIIWPPIAILGPRSRRYARTISSSVGSTTRQAGSFTGCSTRTRRSVWRSLSRFEMTTTPGGTSGGCSLDATSKRWLASTKSSSSATCTREAERMMT